MLVKFYWKKKPKQWAMPPYKPEVIDEDDFVRQYECKNVTEAWKLWSIDCNHKISHLKYEAFAIISRES